MVWERSERIEAAVDTLAAALYAAATALVLAWMNASSPYVAAGTVVAFGGAFFGLRSVEPQPAAFAMPTFAVEVIDCVDEMILSDGDRMLPPTADDDALILDDVIPPIGPDSRVVRLFDRDAMPKSPPVARNPGEAGSASAPPDASQALHEALAQLRNSLR